MLIIFFEKYTPLTRGKGGIFSEQQTLPPPWKHFEDPNEIPLSKISKELLSSPTKSRSNLKSNSETINASNPELFQNELK